MNEPRPTTISARPCEMRSSVANCSNKRTGSTALRTATALVSRMRLVRAAAAARITAGAESRNSLRWCSPMPNTSRPTWSANSICSMRFRMWSAGRSATLASSYASAKLSIPICIVDSKRTGPRIIPMAHTNGVRKRKVAVLGATGTVGQRFISLLAGHPWFELAALTTSDRNVGKRYGDVTPWHFGEDMPAAIADMRLEAPRAELDAEICFSALPSEAAEQWESTLAKAGHHVFSNVKTHRMDEDVPLIIAEVNAEHMHALDVQRRNRGWAGAIVTNG